MDTPVKLLIVEDDMIIAANISLQLSNLGYEVTAIVPRGEEAILQIQENQPDIVLLDIHLKGALDGIATAHEMQKNADIPIIYLTANADEATFNRAKTTRPHAFISKPFRKLDLQRAIELTISRMAESQALEIEQDRAREAPFILSDRIFVRHKERMVKIFIEDIFYIEAERNYCRIFTKNKEYLLATTLKLMEEKLPARHFIRIHRSYIINLSQVDEVAESHVVIARKAIPLSKSLREELLKRIQTI
ncbi:MAG TPA: response regulator [Saprospiraceae bacterium]|nr:response regulator [Saprospiraceae bacterium]HMP23988.1 response regulator [Saprospiraceae bacterium]